MRIQPARLVIGGDGLGVEPAITAGVDESGKQLWIITVTVGLPQQAHETPLRFPKVRLEVCVKLVRYRKSWVELEGAAKRFLCTLFAIGRPFDDLADNAVAAAKVSPRGSEIWVQLQAALIQVARPH